MQDRRTPPQRGERQPIRKAAVRDVPVWVPGADPNSTGDTAKDQPRASANQAQDDEAIRRMIEAAYT